jgi:hypothetical protein
MSAARTGLRWEHWEQVSYFAWLDVFRDFPAPPAVKLTGYALASYATYKDGHDAHPGLDLLMMATGYNSKQTIVTALAKLRELGLIERRIRGSAAGRRGLADMYYLTLNNAVRQTAGHKFCDCKAA